MKFTKDEVIKLFKRTKLKPTKCDVLIRDTKGNLCGCLIGALYLDEHKKEKIPKKIDRELESKIYDWADQKFGVQDAWYMINSFDSGHASKYQYRGIAAASKQLIKKGEI